MKYKSEGAPDFDKILTSFETFDRNKSGFITTKELKHVLTKIGEKMTEEEFDEVMRATKMDSAHKVKYVDFISTFQEFSAANAK